MTEPTKRSSTEINEDSDPQGIRDVFAAYLGNTVVDEIMNAPVEYLKNVLLRNLTLGLEEAKNPTSQNAQNEGSVESIIKFEVLRDAVKQLIDYKKSHPEAS